MKQPKMRIGRTLPPAAAPLTLKSILSGFRGLMDAEAAIDGFRKSIRQFFHTEHCFLVSSGAAALTIILRAIKKNYASRDLVLIPAYTCYSVPSAIKRAGLKICPCDINPNTLDFNREKLASAIESHRESLLAVVPTHLFGLPANVKEVKNIIGQAPISVIEDAAQVMGAKGEDGFLGCSGDVGFFSLGRGKAYSAMGGGIIITNNEKIADELAVQVEQCPEPSLFQVFRSILITLFVFGFSRPALFWLPKSMPFLRIGETAYNTAFDIHKLSAFQAGIAIGWEDRLAGFQSDRKANAQHWTHLARKMRFANGFALQTCLSNLIRYPMCIEESGARKALLRKSNQKGLGIMPGYPDAVTHIPELRNELSGFDSIQARCIAEKLVTLPTHSWVTAMDRRRIAIAMAFAAFHS